MGKTKGEDQKGCDSLGSEGMRWVLGTHRNALSFDQLHPFAGGKDPGLTHSCILVNSESSRLHVKSHTREFYDRPGETYLSAANRLERLVTQECLATEKA
jgi:hypothetical protein